jgi:toxin YoeB
MAVLKIVWTQTAIKQRNFIFEYWKNRNGNTIYINKLNRLVKERLLLLLQNPKLGKLSEHEGARMVSMRHYSIFYKHLDNRIIIIGLWDNRQDPMKLLTYLKSKPSK